MIKVPERSRELYASFREEFGRMADDIRYRIACVNNTLRITHLEHLNVESVLWQAFLRGAKDASRLQDQVDGLRVLCEQNGIEIPEERELSRLGRKKVEEKT
jgi:hypothetical protein